MRTQLITAAVTAVLLLGLANPAATLPTTEPAKSFISSVVTSLSMVDSHDGISRDVEKPTQILPASPAVLLSPDKFQFQTYNKNGNLVLQQMTKQQIQSLTAVSGDHTPIEITEPQSAGETPMAETEMADVIQKVQDILKEELSKPVALPTAVTTIPGHVNSQWGNILPSILSGDPGPAPVHDSKLPSPAESDKTSEERPMIPVPMIPVEDKVFEQDLNEKKPLFEPIDIISTDTTIPVIADQVAGASEAIHGKPVVVKRPENISASENTNNETVTDIQAGVTESKEQADSKESELSLPHVTLKPEDTREPDSASTISPDRHETTLDYTKIDMQAVTSKNKVESTTSSAERTPNHEETVLPTATLTPATENEDNSKNTSSTTTKPSEELIYSTVQSSPTPTNSNQPPLTSESVDLAVDSSTEGVYSSTTTSASISDASETLKNKVESSSVNATVEKGSPAAAVDPLSLELASSLSSMMSQVSENTPPIISASPEEKLPPRPMIEVATVSIDTQTVKTPEISTKKPEELNDTPAQSESVDKTDEKPSKLSIQTSTALPAELTEGISSSTALEEIIKGVTEVKQEEKTSSEMEILPAITLDSDKLRPKDSATQNPSILDAEKPNEDEKLSNSPEVSTASPIIFLNITKAESMFNCSSTADRVEGETESPMTKIHVTSIVSGLHQTLEGSPVQNSTPAVETITLPSTENASPNVFASGLIAGFIFDKKESTGENTLNLKNTTEVDSVKNDSKTPVGTPTVPVAVVENESESSTKPAKTSTAPLSTTRAQATSTQATTDVKIIEDKTSSPVLSFSKPLFDDSKVKDEATTVKPAKPEPALMPTVNNEYETLVPVMIVGDEPVKPPNTDLASKNDSIALPEGEISLSTAAPIVESPIKPKNESLPCLSTENVREATAEPSVGKIKDQKKDSSMEKKTQIPAKPEEPTKWTEISQESLKPFPTLNIPSTTTLKPTTISPNGDLISLHHLKTPSLDTTTKKLQPDIAYFVNLCNDLAFSFWRSINSGLSTSRSIVVSPFGMTSMLAMIFLGARGLTSTHMNDVLKLDDVSTFNPHLVFLNITDSVSLAKNQGIINAAFVRELFADRAKVPKLMPFYKNQAQQFYDGIVTETTFSSISDAVRRRTNLAIRKQTGNRIKDFIKGNTIPLRSPLAAFSANVFQTDCSSPDATSEGRDGELYFAVEPAVRQRKLVPVPATLWKAGVLAGYEPSLDATAIALGNVTNMISTIFVVPGQSGVTAVGDTLEKLEERIINGTIHSGAWNKLLKVIVSRPGLELQVPKFSHKSVINATAALKAMKLQDLFEKHADLKGMGVNGGDVDLHLADVLQMNLFTTCGDENILNGRHHIEVFPGTQRRNTRNFEGSDDPENLEQSIEEGAITRSARQASEKIQPRLKLDRPFLYFVRHNPTGFILHMGRFNPRLLP